MADVMIRRLIEIVFWLFMCVVMFYAGTFLRFGIFGRIGR